MSENVEKYNLFSPFDAVNMCMDNHIRSSSQGKINSPFSKFINCL